MTTFTDLPDELLEYGPMDIDMRAFSPDVFREDAAMTRVAACIAKKDYRETRRAVRHLNMDGQMDDLISNLEATSERQKALADLLDKAMVRLALAAVGIDREENKG